MSVAKLNNVNIVNLSRGGKIEHVDSLTTPKPTWSFAAGIWRYGTLIQEASDVPMARALDTAKPFTKLNTKVRVYAKPDLVDSEYRLVGLLAREYQNGTHYFGGIMYNDRESRLRIYKQYSEFTVVVQSRALPTIGQCVVGSALVNATPPLMVRGLTPRWRVRFIFLDGTYDEVDVPLNQTYITYSTLKLITRVEIYDAAGNLVIAKDIQLGDMDDVVYGGPGTYVLLADMAITWNYDWVDIEFSVRDTTIEVSVFGGQATISAIDNEIYGVGHSGIRAYNAPSRYRLYARLR